MRSVEIVATFMLAGLAPAAPVMAQDANHMTACTSKAECDAYADERDTAARQAEWSANVKRADDFTIQRQQQRQQARARVEGDKMTRIQEVMRRRREAAAQAGN